MNFTETPLEGAYIIDINPIGDERGFFARLFCKDTFKKQSLEEAIIQVNNSRSLEKGTLRGMHYQLPPKAETKVIRCIEGAIYDVILDLRSNSPTFGQSFGIELNAENRRMLYVPKGFAHGFLTLTDVSEVIYFVSEAYSKEHERGIRWNDPAFEISWPSEPKKISERDQSHPNFNPLNKILVEA